MVYPSELERVGYVGATETRWVAWKSEGVGLRGPAIYWRSVFDVKGQHRGGALKWGEAGFRAQFRVGSGRVPLGCVPFMGALQHVNLLGTLYMLYPPVLLRSFQSTGKSLKASGLVESCFLGLYMIWIAMFAVSKHCRTLWLVQVPTRLLSNELVYHPQQISSSASSDRRSSKAPLVNTGELHQTPRFIHYSHRMDLAIPPPTITPAGPFSKKSPINQKVRRSDPKLRYSMLCPLTSPPCLLIQTA